MHKHRLSPHTLFFSSRRNSLNGYGVTEISRATKGIGGFDFVATFKILFFIFEDRPSIQCSLLVAVEIGH